MAPSTMKTKPKPAIAISQDAFDAVVKESMEDFDMDLAEAVQDAVQTFQIQGADLADIVWRKVSFRSLCTRKELEPSLEAQTDITDIESPQIGDDKMVEVVVERLLAKDDNMANAELPLSSDDQDFEPPLSEAKIGQPSVAVNDNNLDDVEPVLAKDDNIANVDLPLSSDAHKNIEPLSEPEIEQPSVAVNVNKLDDVEFLVETKENLVEVDNAVAKDHNLERLVAEPGNPEQLEPPTAQSDSMDVQYQFNMMPKYDDWEEIEPPVATAGIVTDGSNIGKADYVHPVVGALKELDKSLLLLRLEDGSYINWEDKQTEPKRVETLFEAAVEALEKVAKLCNETEPENCQIAVKYGGVEASIQAYYALQTYRISWGSLAFKVLHSLIAGDSKDTPSEEPGKEVFLKANGPQVVLEALAMENIELYEPMNRELSCIAANALALAAAKNETLKNAFMDLGADEALVKYLKNHAEEMGSDGAALQAACEAIRSLTVADDDRPAASNAFKNAMKIAKAGAMDAFIEILPQRSKALPNLPSLCLTLKSLAVNDEICRDFAEEGGLDMVLNFLDYACKYPNKIVGRTSCALLSQLAGSDANKEAIVKSGGLQKIFQLMKCYNEHPSVLQEGFAAIATLTLRSPQHVTKAVEAGALDIAAEVMETHPNAPYMLRQACQMVRNLNVRNPENRPISLEKGLEPLLRRAKDTHEICKDVASAALRDIGIEDYL